MYLKHLLLPVYHTGNGRLSWYGVGILEERLLAFPGGLIGGEGVEDGLVVANTDVGGADVVGVVECGFHE